MVSVCVCSGEGNETENESLKGGNGGEGESKSCLARVLGIFPLVYNLAALFVSGYFLMGTYVEITDKSYVVLSTHEACGEAGVCNNFDILEDLPDEAVIVDQDFAIFSNMKVDEGKGDEPYECKTVGGEIIDAGTDLYNPACGSNKSCTDQVFNFGPSSNGLRIAVIWLSIVAVIFFDIAMQVIEILKFFGYQNIYKVLANSLQEMGVPESASQGAVSAVLFVVKGVLLVPSVLVALFDMSDEHNPCLGLNDDVDFTVLLALQKIFLVSPVCFVLYAVVYANAQNEEEEKGSSDETQKRKEMAVLMAKVCVFAFLAAATITSAYVLFCEAIGNPFLFLAHLNAVFGSLLSACACF